MTDFTSISASISIKRLEKNPIKVMETLNLTQAKKLINAFDDAYDEGDPLVDDTIYDTIRDYISERWPKSTLAKKIGSHDDSDVPLPVPMASLDQLKLASPRLAKQLSNGNAKIVSDKLDGQSVEIVYEKGVPVKAFTRGDSEKGKDITRHIGSMNIPKKIPVKERFVVRCEALLSQKKFLAKLHKDAPGDYEYVSARPASVGLMRRFESPPEIKLIDMVCFGILAGNGATKTKAQQFATLKKYGFTVVRHFGPFDDLSEEQLVALLEERVRKSKYELDGLVVSDNIPSPASKSTNPKHEFKFKMNTSADVVIATVKDIIYQETKYGVLAPVVIVEPVVVPGGITINRANGHNGYYVQHGYLKPTGKNKAPAKKMPLGPGAKIKLVRSNKVIPYIMEIVRAASKPKLPDVPYTLDGVEFRAKKKTSTSEAKLLESFMASVGYADAGESSARLLVEAGIKDPKALILCGLTTLRTILGDARGKKVASFSKKLLAGVDLNVWLKSIAPYYMRGANTSFDKVVDQIPDIQKILRRGSSSDLNSLIGNIHGIKSLAPKIADACINGYNTAKEIGVKLNAPKKIVVKSTALKGVNVAFTGVRDAELKARITELGGTASDSMKADTTVLIAKDPGSGSSKVQKAMDKGIPIYTPDQFRKKYKVT